MLKSRILTEPFALSAYRLRFGFASTNKGKSMKTFLTARHAAFYLLFAISTLLIGSCASSQSSSNGNTYTRTASGAIVTVTEDEYHIHMPTTIPDGSITFHVTNSGSKTHNFKIKGNGVEQQLS